MTKTNGTLDFAALRNRVSELIDGASSWLVSTPGKATIAELEAELAAAVAERDKIGGKLDSLTHELDRAEKKESAQVQQAAEAAVQGDAGFVKTLRTKLRGFGMAPPREARVVQAVRDLLEAEHEQAGFKLEELNRALEREVLNDRRLEVIRARAVLSAVVSALTPLVAEYAIDEPALAFAIRNRQVKPLAGILLGKPGDSAAWVELLRGFDKENSLVTIRRSETWRDRSAAIYAAEGLDFHGNRMETTK